MEQLVRITLDQVVADAVRLHYQFDEGTPALVRMVPLSNIAELLDRAETDYYVVLPDDADERLTLLRSLGSALYQFLDTSDRLLSGYIERTTGTWDVLVLALTAVGRLAHLPWELLYDRDRQSFLVSATRPVVPVRLMPGTTPPREPQPHSLRLLFAACAPDGVPVPLDFEYEEAQIWEVTQRQQIELQVEESGNLTELQELLRSHGEDHFDVVHLTGHAVHSARGPRFLTETPLGERFDASADDLRTTLEHRWPALIFLSGCRTAEAADIGAVPSLAEELIGQGLTPVVVGWGRPVSDEMSTKITSVLYRALAQGLSPGQALADTYRSMLYGDVPHWHMLRVFICGGMPGPLVTPALSGTRDQMPVVPQWQRIAGIIPVPERAAFVGRRREVQRLLRLLHPVGGTHHVGILVHGMGGIGKSTLIGRVVTRLGDTYHLVVFKDYLTARALLDAIAADLELAIILDGTSVDAPLRQRLLNLLNNSPYRLLFVLDEFELNFRPEKTAADQIQLVGDRAQVRPEAAAVFCDLVEAIRQSSKPHRIVVTSRYVPSVDVVMHFDLVALSPLRERDVDKMIIRLRREPPISGPAVDLIRRLAGQNPRLLVWLFNVARQNLGVDEASLQARLRNERISFLETNIFADTLLAQLSRASLQLLRAAVSFRVYVSAEVLARLLDDDEQAVLACARNLADLGLLEADKDAAGFIMVRVPLVLETRLRDEDPDGYRRMQANCAAALAVGLPDIVREPDPRRLDQAWLQEVHRLAIAGATRDLAVITAVGLAKIQIFYYRFEDAARICRQVLDIYPDHRLYWLAAVGEECLGRSQAAELFLDRAAASCPAEAIRDRALILLDEARYTAQRNPPHAEEQLREAERMAREYSEDDVLAAALTQLASIYAEIGGARSRAVAEPLFEEARTVAERIADSRISVADVLISCAFSYLQWDDPDRAMLEIETAIGIYEREGMSLHQAVALIAMSAAFLRKGDLDAAVVAMDHCEPIVHSLAWAYGKAVCISTRGFLAMAQDQNTESEILLNDALATAREVGNPELEGIILSNQLQSYRASGETEKADEAFRALLDLWDRAGAPLRHVEELIRAAEADGDAGDLDAAVRQARDAADRAHIAGSPKLEAHALDVYVRMRQLAQPTADDLEPTLRTLAELQKSLDDKLGEWNTLISLGGFLIGADRVADAGPVLDHAADLGDVGQGVDNARMYAHLATVSKEQGRTRDAMRHWLRSASIRREAHEWASVSSALMDLGSALAEASTLLGEHVLGVALVFAQAAGPDAERRILETLADLAAGTGRTYDAGLLRSRAENAERRGTPIMIELGSELYARLSAPDMSDFVLGEIARIRQELQADEDMVLPWVRYTDHTVRFTEEIALDVRDYAIYFWGQRVWKSSVPTDSAAIVGEFDAIIRPTTVTEEPGFLPQRMRWLGPDQMVGAPDVTIVGPATVIVGNLKQLARVHRSTLDDDRPRSSADVSSESQLPSLDSVEACLQISAALAEIADGNNVEAREHLQQSAQRATAAGAQDITIYAWATYVDLARRSLTRAEAEAASARLVELYGQCVRTAHAKGDIESAALLLVDLARVREQRIPSEDPLPMLWAALRLVRSGDGRSSAETAILASIADALVERGDEDDSIRFRVEALAAARRADSLRLEFNPDAMSAFADETNVVMDQFHKYVPVNFDTSLVGLNLVTEPTQASRSYTLYAYGRPVLQGTVPADRAITLPRSAADGPNITAEPGLSCRVRWLSSNEDLAAEQAMDTPSPAGRPHYGKRGEPDAYKPPPKAEPVSPGMIVYANLCHYLMHRHEAPELPPPPPSGGIDIDDLPTLDEVLGDD
ncbi:MAG: CHAT domain-containing protein [Streptosporangiaceae bacterium]